MLSAVTRVPAADSARARDHFSALLAFETDCWDTHHAISNDRKDFVLVDVRAESLFMQSHIPTAINIPHRCICEKTLTQYPHDTLFVVYCAGPHCNGADKAALALARLNRPVKKMIGGVAGWLDEDFDLVS